MGFLTLLHFAMIANSMFNSLGISLGMNHTFTLHNGKEMQQKD